MKTKFPIFVSAFIFVPIVLIKEMVQAQSITGIAFNLTLCLILVYFGTSYYRKWRYGKKTENRTGTSDSI